MTSVLMLTLITRGNRLLYTKRIKLTSINFISPIMRWKTDNYDDKSHLGTSTILLQDGAVVQELPLIVRKVKDIMELCKNTSENASGLLNKAISGDVNIHRMISKEFNNCSSYEDVLSLLSKCSSITPNIAVGAIERIYGIDSNSIIDPESKNDVIEKLFDVIIKSNYVNTLLTGMNVISPHNKPLTDKLCDEILERVTDNKFSVHQLCDIVTFFNNNKNVANFSENIDKLWVGFTDRDEEFDEDTFLHCFRVLPHFKKSQRLIFRVLEKRFVSLWWQMKPDSIIETVDIMIENRFNSNKIFSSIGRWMNTNIHVLSEDVLLEIITKFTQMKYSDRQIEKAIERYVKAKGIKVKSHSLIVAIMSHCKMFRIRNAYILNGCVEYFIAQGKYFSPMFIKSILFPLGLMAFRPNNAARFWEEVESVFQDKFAQINVEDVLDIMLACIFLEKFPLNFVDKVFNPHFLERINSSPNTLLLRNKLKLIDTAMTLECKAYQGPLLPRDHWSKSLWQDGRIKRMVNHVLETLELVAGGPDFMSTSVILPHLFTTELYVVDVMFHPKGLRNSILNLNLSTDRNINVALLVMLPEHFCGDRVTLLGPQCMRIRHFKALGLKVATVEYEVISRLKMHRKELEKYLVEKLKSAESAV